MEVVSINKARKLKVVSSLALCFILLFTQVVVAESSSTSILAQYGMDKESLREVVGVIKAESHNTYESKLATANVILNQKKLYPSLTMAETLRVSKQWETVTNGKFKNVVPDKECVIALVDAMNGVTNVGNAVYFYNPKVCVSEWHETQAYVATVGDQRYFERVTS